MLTTKLILERLDKEGRLLERRQQQSRSFLKQFIQFLYMAHIQIPAGSPYSMTDITGVARDVDNAGSGSWHNCKPNLAIAAPPGLTGVLYNAFSANTDRWQGVIQGEKIGIQVGRGTTSPTPTDYKIEDRILHGRCGKAGAKADFLNPSFETGDLTNWTPASSANMAAGVDNGVWALKDGSWYCTLLGIASGSAGEYAQVSQDIDLSNITHLRFQLRGQLAAGDFAFEIFVDGRPVYSKVGMGANTDYPNQIADVCTFTGVHTVTFRCIAIDSYTGTGDGVFLDNIETLQLDPEIEYGGCELMNINFSDPNGEFTIRRYFTNNSGLSITVNEVGIYSPASRNLDTGYAWPFCIARDVVSPGVAVADTEILRVTYVPQITV